MRRPAAARPDLPDAPQAAPKRRGVLRRPAAAPAAPAAEQEPLREAPGADGDRPLAAEPASFDHKGCSKCKKEGHGCARCKPFATQGINGYFWLDGEVVRKIP